MVKNKSNKTPVDLANEKGYNSIINLFSKKRKSENEEDEPPKNKKKSRRSSRRK